MTRRGWLAVAGAGIATIALSAAIDPLPRLMWNATASAPTGLYLLQPSGRLRRGDLVAVAPSAPLARWLSVRGYVPHGVPLLKHVAALAGQRVCRAGTAVMIDARVIGMARLRDSRGRPLPVWSGCRVLNRDQVFLMNADVPDSLDGRYFGAMPTSAVIARAVPMLTRRAPDAPSIWQDPFAQSQPKE